MKNKIKEKQFSFDKEELTKLKDLEAAIIVSNAQIDGMHIYKNAILSATYKRLGIDGDAPEGMTKGIRYNLVENKILYTETPIEKKEEVKEEK